MKKIIKWAAIGGLSAWSLRFVWVFSAEKALYEAELKRKQRERS